ncbi:hypothetical protein J5N97_019590 [Dioscorea zingiberensis]|uniref:Uncharacterized protein n=1 Tax=Dioscorea zingiberensis TaxID=325984 RepID=A0A9D5CE55_9LILI|nr:hypothetical protein J5N97_019590 [Dioscorea zingiberensis]
MHVLAHHLKVLSQLPYTPPPSGHHRARPRGNVISWTASISRYARNGLLSEAMSTFSSMLVAGVLPNSITLATLLSACADYSSNPLSLPLGISIHALVFKCCPDHGLDDVVLGTALVDMYAKCGLINVARRVFDGMTVKNSVTCNTMIDGYMKCGEVNHAISVLRQMSNRDKVSWTALINGCIRNKLFEDALEYFREMQAEDIVLDYVIAIAVLAVCANLGALGQGLWMHCLSMRHDFRDNIRLNNSLIDMYSRCGRVDLAFQVFTSIRERNRVSWNSMIVGFATNGYSREALDHFSMMLKTGFEPDGVSFTGVLTACSHAGLIEIGLKHYDVMQRVYGIVPRMEHYGCVIDLLARAGYLEDAMHLLERMPMKPNVVILTSLLAACRTHGDAGLAERLMGYLVELEPDCDSNFVLLSNIYATLGKWTSVGEVRGIMKAWEIKRRPGFSAVEIDCGIHEFMSGDRSHPESDGIYDMLDILGSEMKLYGYHPQAIMSGLPLECE